MYNTIRIHLPAVALPDNVVKISTFSTIPAELREAVQIVNCELWLDTNDGIKTAPSGSLVCFEKSEQTPSGYNCWVVATPHTALVKVDGKTCVKPSILHAMLIPDKDEAKPLWVNGCNLTYNGDGTATLKTENGCVSGRIGIDFLLCHGLKKDSKSKVSILATYDESYNDYIVCDESGKDLGNLSDFYPA